MFRDFIGLINYQSMNKILDSNGEYGELWLGNINAAFDKK